jgi:hypothetical protein
MRRELKNNHQSNYLYLKLSTALKLDGFENIGEKTFVKYNNERMVIVQKIKLHLIVTTVLMGLVLTSWFRFYPTLLVSLIGLLECFACIRLEIQRDIQRLMKDVYFLRWKIFPIYSLNDLDTYEVTECETEAGYEINLTNGQKTKVLLVFSKSSNRQYFIKTISEFIASKTDYLQQKL